MSIVTISRGSYSRGKEVAETLDEELGYECISHEILVEASQEFKIPETKLTHALHDAPSLFDHFQNNRDQYINFFKSSFYKHLQKGNVVYHGLAGHFFLRDVSHVLKVRINAQMRDRIKEEMKRENCSEIEARERIEKDDRDRRYWSRQVCGVDTWDSRLYDMVFCVDSLTVADIVDILAKTVRKEQFQETRKSIEKMKNLLLEAQIKAMTSSVSPHVKVRFLDNASVELYNVDGILKGDKDVRADLTKRLKQELELKEVVYNQPVTPPKNYINNFYNLEMH